jgi:hypothetical protein
MQKYKKMFILHYSHAIFTQYQITFTIFISYFSILKDLAPLIW